MADRDRNVGYENTVLLVKDAKAYFGAVKRFIERTDRLNAEADDSRFIKRARFEFDKFYRASATERTSRQEKPEEVFSVYKCKCSKDVFGRRTGDAEGAPKGSAFVGANELTGDGIFGAFDGAPLPSEDTSDKTQANKTRKKGKEGKRTFESAEDFANRLGAYLREERGGRNAFCDKVSYFIEKKGYEDHVMVYLNAGLSRQDFSRIMSPGAKVSKKFVWSMAIGLHLDLDEADELLHSAGYYRTKRGLDGVMTFSLANGVYDIYLINYSLEKLDLPLLSHKTIPPQRVR